VSKSGTQSKLALGILKKCYARGEINRGECGDKKEVYE